MDKILELYEGIDVWSGNFPCSAGADYMSHKKNVNIALYKVKNDANIISELEHAASAKWIPYPLPSWKPEYGKSLKLKCFDFYHVLTFIMF